MVSAPDIWRDRRVLLTGATGLLGSWLARELQARGAHLVALVRDHVPQARLWETTGVDRLTVVTGALEDYPLIRRTIGEYEIELVMHLAAQTIVPIANRDPLSTFETNIRGTWHVLEAARRAGTRVPVVVASSDKAYGQHDHLPYDESFALQGRHPYDVSKTCADLLATAYQLTWAQPVAIVRCGNLFGPGDLNFNRLIPGTIRSILRGEQPIVRSDGTFIRDYLFVGDAALAYVLVGEGLLSGQLDGEAFNFSNEVQLTVLEIVDLIRRRMNTSLQPVILGSARGEIAHQYLDATKARRMLGWSPSYSMEEAISLTIAWYEERLALEGAALR